MPRHEDLEGAGSNKKRFYRQISIKVPMGGIAVVENRKLALVDETFAYSVNTIPTAVRSFSAWASMRTT